MFSIIYFVAVFAFPQCCRRALPVSYALAPLDSVSMAEAVAFHGAFYVTDIPLPEKESSDWGLGAVRALRL